MTRAIFDQEHEAFREAVGTFLDKEVVPFHDQWERDGIVDREVWAKAGAQGLLGLQLDEEYGGGGTPDFRYNVVIGEEMTRARRLRAGVPAVQRHDRARTSSASATRRSSSSAGSPVCAPARPSPRSR